MSSYKVPEGFTPLEMNNSHDFGKEKTNDAEIFLIRVPKGYDVNRLNGTEFCPGQIKEIGVERGPGELSTVYELSTFSGQDLDVTPLLSSESGFELGPKITNFLSVNKTFRVNEMDVPLPVVLPPHGRVPMPDGLKARFTPFGSNIPFKEQKIFKSSRKRKHRGSSCESGNLSDNLKPSKKRKMNTTDDGIGTPKRKHKKRRHLLSESKDSGNETFLTNYEDSLDTESVTCEKRKNKKFSSRDKWLSSDSLSDAIQSYGNCLETSLSSCAKKVRETDEHDSNAPSLLVDTSESRGHKLAQKKSKKKKSKRKHIPGDNQDDGKESGHSNPQEDHKIRADKIVNGHWDKVLEKFSKQPQLSTSQAPSDISVVSQTEGKKKKKKKHV